MEVRLGEGRAGPAREDGCVPDVGESQEPSREAKRVEEARAKREALPLVALRSRHDDSR